LRHVAKFGGEEPHPKLAEGRREYIFQLCEALISRHPDPTSALYSATASAQQLESEGLPHKHAVVVAVKQQLFAENGFTYLANWHPKVT